MEIGSYIKSDMSITNSTMNNSGILNWPNSWSTTDSCVTSVYSIDCTNTVLTTYDNSNTITSSINSKGSLTVTGDADFHGDLRIGGNSLSDRLDKIEQRLAILRPNTDLESRWDRLKELGDEYRKLEKEILEKENIYKILKR